jgi:Ca2+-binding EF-hand superfamily protein
LQARPTSCGTGTAAAQRDEERGTPLGAFKEALASNLRRVSELFHKWEVSLDERIDLHELRDAVGVLNLARSPAWDEDCVSKLYAQLDGDNSGYIEFARLHDLLKRYEPPELAALKRDPLRRGSSLISLQPPVAKLPPMGPARPEIAVTNLERQLIANQSRVIERFRRMDSDAITATELRRAMSSLCIHADAKTTEKLFKLLLDVEGAGSITLDELSQILVRRVSSKGSLKGTGTWQGPTRWPRLRRTRTLITPRRRLVRLLLTPTQPRVPCIRFRRRRQADDAQHDAQHGAPCRGSQSWGHGALSIRTALVASRA